MSPQSSRDEQLFADALARPKAERALFLAQACGGDAALLARVAALLAAHEGPDSVMTSSPVTRAAPLPEEKPGDRIGHYKLLQQIGEGGCGVVYMAEQEEPVRRRVALKIIKLGMDTKSVVARFEAERQALAMMDHANIAKVHDAGATATGRPFFVMELVRGIPITKYCDENHLNPTARLELFIKVCQAIQHAHQKGVIHRDIKPSNILVTVNDGPPTPKVIDFGIAKATLGKLTDATIFTAFEQFIGTPAYMSPEQAEMSSLDIDTRSDIYSLGVLLYELLTGRLPFDPKVFAQAGVDQIRQQIREAEPQTPSRRLHTLEDDERTTIAKLRNTVPAQLSLLLRGDLDWIVMRCLEKDRTRRYDTANGLAMDVQRFLRDEPVIARPPSTAYLLQKLIRRNRVAAIGCVIVASVLVVGAVVSTWQAVRATRAERQQIELRRAAQVAQAKEAELRRVEAELRVRAETQELATRERAYAADMQLVQQALGLDNLVRAQDLLDRYRPLPGQRDLRGWEWRYLWQLSRPDYVRQLGRKFGTIKSLALSPNGEWLAVADSGPLSIWNISTGQEIRVTAIPAAGRVAFAPTGLLLAASASGRSDDSRLTGRRIVLWDLRTRQIVRELPMVGPCGGIRFSSDGQTLVVATQSPANNITVWNVADGTELHRFDAPQYNDNGQGTSFAASPDTRLAAHELEGQLRVIDLNTGSELWQSEAAAKGSFVMSLAFSPDSAVIASGAGVADPSIRLWDAATGKLIRRLDGHRRWVGGLQFSRDGKTLVSASADLTIGIWDVESGTLLKTLRGHKLEVWRLALLSDTTLISGGKDGFVYLWDIASRRNVAQTRLAEPIGTWRFGADSHSLLAVDYDGRVTLHRGRGFTERNTVMELGPLGPMRVGANPVEPVNRVRPEQISPDLRLIAVQRNAAEPEVEVWDTMTSSLRHRFPAAPNTFPVAVFADDRTLRVFADRSGNSIACREWDLVTGGEIRSWRMPCPAAGLLRITFSPDGHRCLMTTASTRGVVHDLRTGRNETIAIVSDTRRFPQFSPEGDRVATSLMSRQVAKLWDASTYRELATFPSTMSVPHSVAFSPDSRRLAVGAGDLEAITLWDANTHEPLLALRGEGTMFLSTAFSPDGNILASRNTLFPEAHGILHLWRAPSWAEIAQAEKAQETSAKKP